MSWVLWLLLTVVMVIAVLLLLLLIQWLLGRRAREEAVPAAQPAPTAMAEPTPEELAEPTLEGLAEPTPAGLAEAAPVAEAEVEAPEPDDLKVIEGIGPKIANLLQQAGIATFAQLAVTQINRLALILEEAQIRLADPSTWPEQAELAAAGDWEALEALQEQLKGGRRV